MKCFHMQLTLPFLLTFLFHVHTVITTNFAFHGISSQISWTRRIIRSITVYVVIATGGFTVWVPEPVVLNVKFYLLSFCEDLEKTGIWSGRKHEYPAFILFLAISSWSCFSFYYFYAGNWSLSYIVWNLNQSYAVLFRCVFQYVN